MSATDTMPDVLGTPRDIRPSRARAQVAIRERWALVVGVSRTSGGRLDLQFAARDATTMRDVLLAQGFRDAQICLLTDEAATRGALRGALRELLTQPERDDVLVIYVAGHGFVQDRVAYLVMHDTDPDNVVATGVAMSEVTSALAGVRAARVLVLTDTCHSAAIGSVERIYAVLDSIAAGDREVAVLSSASTDERAYEDPRWDGHGVFTYFLLQGLRGAADGYRNRPRDGTVTLGELFDYVRDNVQRGPSIGSTRSSARARSIASS